MLKHFLQPFYEFKGFLGSLFSCTLFVLNLQDLVNYLEVGTAIFAFIGSIAALWLTLLTISEKYKKKKL